MFEAVDPYQVLLLMAAVAYAAFLLGRASVSAEPNHGANKQNAEQLLARLSPSEAQEIDQLLRDGAHIEAIKEIRSATGAGLREAKLAADYRRTQVKAR